MEIHCVHESPYKEIHVHNGKNEQIGAIGLKYIAPADNQQQRKTQFE